jgi:hypothetical protein
MARRTTESSFDELAKGLAEGSISRRRALKLFAGTAIAALIPSRALADDDCVRICHVPFDRQTGRCFFGQRENRCVPRSRLQVHLEEHPCDCRGRCRTCTRPTTTSTTTSSTTSTTTSTTSTSTTTPMCLPNQTSCTADTQCCSGICTTPSGASSPFCFSCRGFGGACAANQTCCSGTCQNGTCCGTIGQEAASPPLTAVAVPPAKGASAADNRDWFPNSLPCIRSGHSASVAAPDPTDRGRAAFPD